MELDPLTDEAWIERMAECRGDGYDMFVAVQKTATGNGQNRRAHAREEPVFGFTYAEDTYGRRNSGRFTATVQVYVNWRHVRIGVGRCLMDRVMTMLNFNHDCKPGVEYVGARPLRQREVKKVLIGKSPVIPSRKRRTVERDQRTDWSLQRCHTGTIIQKRLTSGSKCGTNRLAKL